MIVNKAAAQQFISFDKLSFDKNFKQDPTGHGIYHPTDFDGVFQFFKSLHPQMMCRQALLIYEFKKEGATVPTGQKRAIEGVVNDVEACNGIAIAVVLNHNVPYEEGDVDASETIVSTYYCHGHWQQPPVTLTALQFTLFFFFRAGLIPKDKGEQSPEDRNS